MTVDDGVWSNLINFVNLSCLWSLSFFLSCNVFVSRYAYVLKTAGILNYDCDAYSKFFDRLIHECIYRKVLSFTITWLAAIKLHNHICFWRFVSWICSKFTILLRLVRSFPVRKVPFKGWTAESKIGFNVNFRPSGFFSNFWSLMYTYS